MKYIDKREEPDFFIQCKNNDKMYKRGRPNWKRLGSGQKRQLKDALIKEQGAVCCYCGKRIGPDDSHIEHYRPRTSFPKLQFEYDNLLCSCQSELQKTEPRICGNAKGSWFDEVLTISPLDQMCESRFEFLEDGSIREAESDDEGAKQTIRHLALDNPQLDELRKSSIAAILDTVDISDDGRIQEQIEIYARRNPENGNYSPFCSAVLNILSDLLT